jgi:AmmeMemoRadiSam system protein B
MANVRPAAAAGLFYPSDPAELRSAVADLLAAAPRREIDVEPQLLIVPHAGYVYSGPVAAQAYRLIPPGAGRVAVLGPSHFVRFTGLATPGVDGVATPLGPVAVDEELTRRAARHEMVIAHPAAHRREHSLEVQLPFLQMALDEFSAVLLATGDMEAEQVADVLDDLLRPGVVGIISSDLSHYLDYDTARRRDARTAKAIEELRPDGIGYQDACGRIAVQAALTVARRRHWRCRRLALLNSGDTAGSRDRVVGYGAFAIGPAIQASLAAEIDG